MERITWDQFFMAQSHLLALRSTCTRLAVGATIVREKRIIAGGYNGSISGDEHCIDVGCYVVDNHCVRTVHAEVNALFQCAKYGTSQMVRIFMSHIFLVYNVRKQLFKQELKMCTMQMIIKIIRMHMNYLKKQMSKLYMFRLM